MLDIVGSRRSRTQFGAHNCQADNNQPREPSRQSTDLLQDRTPRSGVRTFTGDCRKADSGTITQMRDGFQSHAAALDRPFIALFEQEVATKRTTASSALSFPSVAAGTGRITIAPIASHIRSIRMSSGQIRTILG
jgi:hypothetical protein